jgi:peptide deformylase
MAVLTVRQLPDPILKMASRPVDRLIPSVQQLIHDLIATMRHHPRCVGLAAPQVGQLLCVAVVDVTGHPKAERSHGLMVLVNPRLTAREGVRTQREGCLSIPDLTGNVSRAVKVRVEALDASGQRWNRWLEGFEAVAVQHELDHLDGTLFLDRVVNVRTDVFRRTRYA